MFLTLFGCSLSQFGWKAEPEPKEKPKSETAVYQEDFDPLTLKDDDIVLPPKPGAGGAGGAVLQPVVIPKTERTESGGETVQGFRVQLMASTDEVQAREVKKTAMLKLSAKVYLKFEAPHYKVRIGDCTTRDEAKLVLQEAVTNGFTDAWIVPSKVHKTGEGPAEP
jgi:hypothetical protein